MNQPAEDDDETTTMAERMLLLEEVLRVLREAEELSAIERSLLQEVVDSPQRLKCEKCRAWVSSLLCRFKR